MGASSGYNFALKGEDFGMLSFSIITVLEPTSPAAGYTYIKGPELADEYSFETSADSTSAPSAPLWSNV